MHGNYNRERFDASIARRCASQAWGTVNHQYKLCCGIWWFSCSNHGGFVVDTDLWPQLKHECEPIIYLNLKEMERNRGGYDPKEQHFASYEEDCDYAKVEWLVPDVKRSVAKRYGVSGQKDIETWYTKRIISLKSSLEQFNPDFLKAHPIPVFASENTTLCKGYCGVSCVDGSCPIANIEEYKERDYDVIRNCKECSRYKGCEDCCFEGTDACFYAETLKAVLGEENVRNYIPENPKNNEGMIQ